jgi:hypothetical protein
MAIRRGTSRDGGASGAARLAASEADMTTVLPGR